MVYEVNYINNKTGYQNNNKKKNKILEVLLTLNTAITKKAS